jgi:hypothetical protein
VDFLIFPLVRKDPSVYCPKKRRIRQYRKTKASVENKLWFINSLFFGEKMGFILRGPFFFEVGLH